MQHLLWSCPINGVNKQESSWVWTNGCYMQKAFFGWNNSNNYQGHYQGSLRAHSRPQTPPCHCTRPEQYHFFYPNTNTQYFQKGLNNIQYQYQFFEEALTIPNTNSNTLKGPWYWPLVLANTQYQYIERPLTIPNTNSSKTPQYYPIPIPQKFWIFAPLISSTPEG